MGYSGYRTYICENGHKDIVDCYEDTPISCSTCSHRLEWSCSTDTTNGYDPSDPYTHEAETEVVSEYNIDHKDHLGNKYCTIGKIYKPIGDRWRKL